MRTACTRGVLNLELLATGPNAHGYGRLDDGRAFAYRVRNRKARLEVYRCGADDVAPAPPDVELVAELPTGKVNLESSRSITALLRTLVALAAPGQEQPERTLRAFLGKLDSMMDSWAAAVAEPLTIGRKQAPRRQPASVRRGPNACTAGARPEGAAQSA